eukprot:7270197-Alexandrium_andersonii.AAC.1
MTITFRDEKQIAPGASPGALPPSLTPPTGASGASGLSRGATAPWTPPTGASGTPEAPVGR